jgi:hypothetical protein
MSIRQFIADVMELPKAINAVNETIGGEGMTHTPDIDEQVNTDMRTGVKWQLQRTPYESEIDIVSDKRVIATIEAGEDKEEIAQMIVSAPDMLEALEEVMGELDVEGLPCPLCGRDLTIGHRRNCIWHVINAAVKKARGEE